MLDYLQCFKPPAIIEIPTVFTEEEINNCGCFDYLHALGNELIFHCYADGDSRYISESLGLFYGVAIGCGKSDSYL